MIFKKKTGGQNIIREVQSLSGKMIINSLNSHSSRFKSLTIFSRLQKYQNQLEL